MAASYAGAEAAIRARLEASWTTTRIVYPNTQPDAPWPPVDGDGSPAPYVALEITSFGNELVGAGKPGSQTWRKDGLIEAHVFVPSGTGDADAKEMAEAIGELFRAAKFYDGETAGCYVRTWAPDVDGGGSGSDDGLWYRVTCSVGFEFWFRG